METIVAVAAAIAILAGILLCAKRFLKPVTGELPDCCSVRGNKDIR